MSQRVLSSTLPDLSDRPLCECHGEPMSVQGRSDKRYWRCRVKNREYIAAWRAAHPEAWRQIAVRYETKNAHRNKKWVESNHEHRMAYLRQLNAERRAAFRVGDLTDDQWEATRLELGERCSYCGAEATTQDHDLPISRGGAHTRGNVVPACGPCNSGKKDRTANEWVLTLLPRLTSGEWRGVA